MLPLTFLLACLVSHSWCALTTQTYTYPDIEVTPAEINFAFNPTATLTVTCSFAAGDIVLSKLSLERRVDGIPELLMFAENGDSSATTTANLAGAAVPGAMFDGGSGAPTEISFSLNSPGQAQLGRYACRPESANTDENDILQPIYYTLNAEALDSTTLINSISALTGDVNIFRARIDALDPPEAQINYSIPIAQLNERIDNLTLEVTTVGSDFTEIEETLARSECIANNTLKTIETLDSAIYIRSEEFNSASTYLLSQYSTITFLTAEANCAAHGGFLAEIDTEAEFNFIADFLFNITSDNQVVLFGAIWDGSQYVNRRDSQPVGYTNFFFAQPDGNQASDECLALYKEFFFNPGVKMEGTYCDAIPTGAFDFAQSILCEIPVGAGVTANCTAA